MARTLLSGNNIVYSGDPLTDLSLPAFLDKFMEKKPKGNRIAEGRWHGGSQIAPAKKVSFVTWIHFVYSECFVY
jgi:ribosome biogenesis protein MAK21